MVALTSTIWRKNSVFRKNKTAKASKGRIFRPFFLGIDNPHKVQSSAFFTVAGQKMDTRFVQAHKEARWALGLTLLYLAVWLVRRLLTWRCPRFYRLSALV